MVNEKLDSSTPPRKKRKLEPERYSLDSKINVIDYLDKNFPQFKDIKDIFQCTDKPNDRNYKENMFKRIAVKTPLAISKMFQFLQQFKKYIYLSESTYDPGKHTSLPYIMEFLDSFGIEGYLGKPGITKEKKIEALDTINDCFNFLYQFVHNESITQDSLFDKYRLQRLRYLDFVNNAKITDDQRIVVDLSPQTSADRITAHSKRDTNINDAFSDEAKTQNERDTSPKFQLTSSKPITAHFDFDLPDSPPESPPLSSDVPLKELEFSEYRRIMDTLNNDIFTSNRTITSLVNSKLIDHKLELMLGFSCCATTSSILKMEICDLSPVIYDYNNGFRIMKNGFQNHFMILRNLQPEYCPVFMSSIQIFLTMTAFELKFSKLIKLSYHEVIQRRNETLKKVNINNVSSLTTMLNVGKKFCTKKGISQSVMDDFEKHKANDETIIAIAKLLSGFHLGKQTALKRAYVNIPTSITQKFIEIIPHYEEMKQDSKLKMLVEFTILVLLQDFPYIFKKYPSNPFKSFPPFNTPEFETYLKNFDYSVYRNDEPKKANNFNIETAMNSPNTTTSLNPTFVQNENIIKHTRALTSSVLPVTGEDNYQTTINLNDSPTQTQLLHEFLQKRKHDASKIDLETEVQLLRQIVNNNLSVTNTAIKNILDMQENINNKIDNNASIFVTKNEFSKIVNQMQASMHKRDRVYVNEIKSLNSIISSLKKTVASLKQINDKGSNSLSLCELEDYRKIKRNNKDYWNELEKDLKELDHTSRSIKKQGYHMPSITPNSSVPPQHFDGESTMSFSGSSSLPAISPPIQTVESTNSSSTSHLFHTTIPMKPSKSVSTLDFRNTGTTDSIPNTHQFFKFIQDWFYGSGDTHFYQIDMIERSLIMNIPGNVAQFYYNNYEQLKYAAKVLEMSFSFTTPLQEVLRLVVSSINLAVAKVQNVSQSVWKTPMSLGAFILHGSQGYFETTIEARLVYISKILTDMKNSLLLHNYNSLTTNAITPIYQN